MRKLLFLLLLSAAADAQIAPGLPADTLACNPTGAVGPPTYCTLGTNLSFSSNVLNATGGGGGLTSVGLADTSTVPIYTVSNSPLTANGTLNLTLSSETANFFFAAPNGAPGQPGFRAIVAADIPTLNQSTTGTAAGLSGSPNITVAAVNANAGLTLTNVANSYIQTSTGLSLTSGTTGFGRNITGTVNDASAVDGIIDFANITCTTCTSVSTLVDWKVGSTSEFNVATSGNTFANGTLTAGNSIFVGNGHQLAWTSNGILTSPAAGQIQVGAANAASPVNQTLSTQGSIGGTSSNVAGANLVIQSGLGTGNSTGSTLTLLTPHSGTTGTTQQTATTQIALGDNTVSMPNLAASSAATTGTVCWTTGGNLTVDTTLACLASTARIKENVHDLGDGLSTVMALRPVSYNLKPEYDPKGLGPQVGLIAEEVQKVDPRLIGVDTGGRPLGVRYMQLTAVLVKAVQDQQHEINSLRRELRQRKH